MYCVMVPRGSFKIKDPLTCTTRVLQAVWGGVVLRVAMKA